MSALRRLERPGIVLAALLLVVLPVAVRGRPTTWPGTLALAALLAGGLALAWWRDHPRLSSTTALGLFLAAPCLAGSPGRPVLGAWMPDTATLFWSAGFAVLALGWSGRGAWIAALGGLVYVAVFARVYAETSPVAALMFTVPPYVAGTLLRLRNQTAEQLAVRARELEEERELFAEIAVRHERARIASELHDIVGHAVSVMVIQAAAGQRLVDADPARAKQAFAHIAESAREGSRDLERLIELLGGGSVAVPAEPSAAGDLSLVDEVVTRAGRSGLQVTCRFEGDRERVPAPVAHLAFRVVQESLTNALRYAPGAEVRIVIAVDDSARGLVVRVENDQAPLPEPVLAGTGRGLLGLRERVQGLGGRFAAGATGPGGWAVEAHVPG